MPSLSCALCSSGGKLKQSHLIPQFVYRGLQHSGGPTCPLLCGACEDRFSAWESRFARDVFHPLVAGKADPVKYGPWLLKFATSVCWRILENARRANQLPAHDAASVESCLKTWNDFLRDRRPDAGAHHIHLLREEGSGRGFMPRLPCVGPALAAGPAASRHESGGKSNPTIAGEVIAHDGATWVYAKMGPLTLFGLIRDDAPGLWTGTRIHLEGKLKPRACVIPAAIRSIYCSGAL